MKTEKDEAVGIIPIFRESDDSYSFLLIHHTKGHWAFPKGHQEEGELLLDTARRELEEETGIKNVEIDDRKEFTENYSFEEGGTHHYKTVCYFIGIIKDKITPSPKTTDEIEDAKWFSYEEASDQLTFPEAQNLLRDVGEHLEILT